MKFLQHILLCAAFLVGCEKQQLLPSMPTLPDASVDDAESDTAPAAQGPTVFVIENGISEAVFLQGPKGIVDITRNTYGVRRQRVNRLCDCAKNCAPPPPLSEDPTVLDVGKSTEYEWPGEVWKVRALDERESCEFAEPAEPGDWSVRFCWAGQLLENTSRRLLDNPACKKIAFKLGSRVEVMIDRAPPEPLLPKDPDLQTVDKRVLDCVAAHAAPEKRETVELEVLFDGAGGWLAQVADAGLKELEFSRCVEEPYVPTTIIKTVPETIKREFRLRAPAAKAADAPKPK